MRAIEHARLVAVEERQRLALDVVEHAHAQVTQEALAGAVDQHVLLARTRRSDARRRRSGRRSRRCAGHRVARRDPVVDAVPDEQRADDEAHRRQRREQRARRRPCGGTAAAIVAVRRRTCLAASASSRSSSVTPPILNIRRPLDPDWSIRARVSTAPRRTPVRPPSPRGPRGSAARGRAAPGAARRRPPCPSSSRTTRVGEGDRAGTVGDDDRGPPLHHVAIAARISCSFDGSTGGGGVVEHQHPRVGQDRPGDGDALALTARQREAALAEHRVVGVGQPHDEVVRAGEPGGALDLLGRGLGIGERDVRGDACRGTATCPRTRCRRRAQTSCNVSRRTSTPSIVTPPAFDVVEARRAGGRRSTCPTRSRRRSPPTARPRARGRTRRGPARSGRSRSRRRSKRTAPTRCRWPAPPAGRPGARGSTTSGCDLEHLVDALRAAAAARCPQAIVMPSIRSGLDEQGDVEVELRRVGRA